MAKPSSRTDLQALRNLVAEAHLILSTTTLPEGRSQRAQELLTSALALADALLDEKSAPPAAALGKRGGKKTAERGPEYYRQIAAMRKTKAGGRPKNDSAGEEKA